jgi:uncharacterized phage-associated protein
MKPISPCCLLGCGTSGIKSHCRVKLIRFGLDRFSICSDKVLDVPLTGTPMPGWSPEIANEFIRLAAFRGRGLDQLQLQALVYIAHGWQLARSGKALTGDRPEAWEFGPVYRRLADILAPFGNQPVTIETLSFSGTGSESILDQSEADLVQEIYQNYGSFESWQLSALTRKGDTPWKKVFADGAGKLRDIPHNLIRARSAHASADSHTRADDRGAR